MDLQVYLLSWYRDWKLHTDINKIKEFLEDVVNIRNENLWIKNPIL